MTFEWDARKAAANLEKHGISFGDGVTVFLDPLAITFPDPDHSLNESREITIGYTMKGYLVFVAHCERGPHSDHQRPASHQDREKTV